MKTNYQNLSNFEASVILVASLGVALVGFEVYAVLPAQSQHQVANAFAGFDLHEQLSQVASKASYSAELVFGATDEFYKQFDIAFAQTFSFPDQIGEPVLMAAQSIGHYSDAIASNYGQNNLSYISTPGKVLGVSLESQHYQFTNYKALHQAKIKNNLKKK